VALAIGLGGGAAVAAPAQANIGVGPASSLKDAFDNSPPDLAQALLCPTISAVGGATASIPGVGTITNQLSSIVCAVNILGYAYRTTYLPPNGPPIVRYHRATALIPAPLDVDGNGSTDFTGTMTASLALAGVGLTISRFGFPADAKVSIEAVLLNPTAPDSYVGFGEDGTKAGTAGSWTGNIGFFGFSANTVDLGLRIAAGARPASLGILGEAFSGSDPDNPQSISRGNVGFTPMPQNVTTEVRLSEGRQQAIVTTGVASKVNAHVDVIRPGTTKDVDLTIDQLPSSVDVVHQTASGHETTTYTANAPINKVSAAYHERQGSSIVTAAALDATAVPTQLAVDQFDGKTSVGASSGAFGSVEARFAKGGDVPAIGAGTGPYVAFHRFTSSKLEGGLRLTNLKSVAFDASGPYSGRLIFSQPLPSVPLSAKDDVSGISATGSLTGLPLDTEVTADMPNGVVTFNGHGQGITQIALSARKTSGVFFTKASRIDATIDNLPAANTFNIKQVDGQVSAAATNPIGSISVLASDGSDAPSVSGPAAWYEDTATRYRGFVRIDKLKGLSFSGSPFSGTIETGAPQVLALHGEVGTLKLDGAIDKLPAKITFSMSDTAGGGKVIDYNSYGQNVGLITLQGDGVPSPVGGGGFLRARVEDLPSHLTATIPANGGKIVFDTHGTYIKRIYAKLWGNEDPGDTVAGRQSLSYSESGQWIVADIHNIGNFEIIPGSAPLYVSYDISSEPLDIGVDMDHKYISATISNPQPASINLDASLGVRGLYQVNAAGPNFRGDGSIDQIDIESNANGGFLEAHLKDVPAKIFFCMQNFSGTLCKPSWIPLSVQADGDNYQVPVPDFAFQLMPTTLQGAIPANRMTLDARICDSTQDPTTCRDNGAKKSRVVVSGLRFNTLEAAFGSEDDGCTVACGRLFGAFSSAGQHLNGRIATYEDGEDDPQIAVNMPDPASFLAVDKKIVFLAYDAVSFDPLDTFSSGTISCGSPKPSAEYETPGPNFDLLGGTFGVCP
jgi:hypothetical protein